MTTKTCPECKAPLVEGVLDCKQSFFTFNLNPRLDKRNWIFQSADGTRQKVLTSFEHRQASRCTSCGLLLIQGHKEPVP